MHLTKEEMVLQNHFSDLIRNAYQRGIPFFSDFTSISERELAYHAISDFYHVPYEHCTNRLLEYGGYVDAKRKILCFMPESSFEHDKSMDYPIACIRIVPSNVKFSEELTHRDYLGTIMGLGITRNQIGDIVIKKQQASGKQYGEAYVFCVKKQAEQLLTITRIRHTTVKTMLATPEMLQWKQEYEKISGSIASPRLDAVLSIATKLPRAKCIPLIQNNLVSLNGRLCTENAKLLKDNDIFTVRGYGKFSFNNPEIQSKKGRYQIIINKYK